MQFTLQVTYALEKDQERLVNSDFQYNVNFMQSDHCRSNSNEIAQQTTYDITASLTIYDHAWASIGVQT